MARWWQRWSGLLLTRQKADEPALSHNVLVISDVHLGEDILEDGPQELQEYILLANRTLVQFIRAHQGPYAGGHPWHLVINGDFFDFIKLPNSSVGRGVDAKAESADDILAKLDRILAVHRPVFKALAEFLLNGHSITIVEGNHDAGCIFEQVRARLRAQMQHLAEQSAAGQADAATRAQQAIVRLQFSSWYVAKLGQYHIEHGHQYDALSSFEHGLFPYAPVPGQDDPLRVVMPMSHLPLSRVAALLGNFSTHGIRELPLMAWLKLAYDLGLRNGWALVCEYGRVCGLLLLEAGKGRRRKVQALLTQQTHRLQQLAKDGCYAESTLRALSAQRAKPAEFSRLQMMHVFFLDRVLLFAFGMALSAIANMRGAPLWASAAIAVATLCGVRALSWAGPPDAREAMRRAAKGISDITGAPYVIFGHSHCAEAVPFAKNGGEGRGAYLNCGSWVTRELLRAEEGEGMTYVQIDLLGAELRRWRGSKGAPLRLYPAPEQTADLEHSKRVPQ